MRGCWEMGVSKSNVGQFYEFRENEIDDVGKRELMACWK